MKARVALIAGALLLTACGGVEPQFDAGHPQDAGITHVDAGVDAGIDAGEVDAGECQPAQTKPCYGGPDGTADAGSCHPGSLVCGADHSWGTSCIDEQQPSTESCNGADDDCNGQVDDVTPAQLSCGQGICAVTVAACANADAGVCTPGTPQSETCNGLDDNCDGVVDDGDPNTICAATAHTVNHACTAGSCSITQCASGYYDVNSTNADGCECQEDTTSATCAGASNFTIAAGGVVIRTGKTVAPQSEDWYQINHSGPGSLSIFLSGNPNDAFRFRVLSSCGSAPMTCNSGSSSTSTNLREFVGGGIVSSTNAGTCGMQTGTPSTVFVAVYRTASSYSCDTYSLQVKQN